MVSVDPSNVSLEAALQATSAMSLRDLPQHVVVGPQPPGAVTITDLPLKDLDPESSNLKHFVDVVLDIPAADVDLPQLKAVFRDQAWHDLPGFMQMKQRPTFEYKTQFFLMPQSDESFCLLKHVYVLSDKVKGSSIALLLQGTGYEIQWGTSNKKLVHKAFQWMLEQLGGSQFLQYSLTLERKPSKSSAPEPEEAGWNFIMEHGELDKSNLRQLRWIYSQINDPDSPICGRSEKLVQKALDSLQNDTCVAKLCTRYDLTMRDVEPEIRDVLEVLVPHLRNHALWLFGEPGKGKTPLGRIVAMLFSRFHGGEGLYRSTCDLDFFRGIQFSKCIPALYDDGDIGGESVKKKKAFCDVADDETMTRERWTNAKFVRNQLRIVLDNAYNPEAERADDHTDAALTIKHEDFYKMIRPALGNIAVTDGMAILKRSAFIVFSKSFVYFRLPSQEPIDVRRIPWKKLDVLLDSSKPTLKNFLEGGAPPGNYDSETQWEQAACLTFWFHRCCLQTHSRPC